MVIATVQSCITGGDSPNKTAVNGKLLHGDDANKYVNKLYEIISGISVGNEERVIKIHKTHLLCVIYHTQRDDKGRIRPALVLWDKDESIENIHKTMKAIGLNKENFDRLYKDYESKVGGASKPFLVVALLAFLAGLLLYLKK